MSLQAATAGLLQLVPAAQQPLALSSPMGSGSTVPATLHPGTCFENLTRTPCWMPRLRSATAPMWACICLVQPRRVIPVEAIGIFQRRSQHHRRTACILPSGCIACTFQNSDCIKKQKNLHFVKQLQIMKCTQNTKLKALDLKYSGFLCPPLSH